MTELDRRSFLKTSAGVAAGTAVIGGPFQGFVAGSAWADPIDPAAHQLVPVQDLRDNVVRLALPPGFQYRSFDDNSADAKLTEPPAPNQTAVPGRHDGMAAFAGPGSAYTLVRNHEVALSGNGNNSAFGNPTTAYDPKAPGGTTTVEVSTTGEVQRSYVSLNGTLSNCSGGPTPWGTWITCEETVNGPDVGPDFTGRTNQFLTKPHGYIFEVPKSGVSDATPIKNAGRFAHESVAWDPNSGALYLSEDNFGFPSGFYKYVPPAGNDPATEGLADGGTLFMLAVKGEPRANLARKHSNRGISYPVEWVPIADPNFESLNSEEWTNDEALTFVSSQGLALGGAKFSRLEGTIYDAGLVYFTSTQGGGAPEATDSDSSDGWGNGWGQIWAYDSRTETLHLLFESPNRNVLDFPDNVTTSPRGTLVVCEDHDEHNFLRGLTRKGKLVTFAQNLMENRTSDEFAGSTFGGETLYVNIQASRGLTFAIWGPWESIGV